MDLMGHEFTETDIPTEDETSGPILTDSSKGSQGSTAGWKLPLADPVDITRKPRKPTP